MKRVTDIFPQLLVESSGPSAGPSKTLIITLTSLRLVSLVILLPPARPLEPAAHGPRAPGVLPRRPVRRDGLHTVAFLGESPPTSESEEVSGEEISDEFVHEKDRDFPLTMNSTGEHH